MNFSMPIAQVEQLPEEAQRHIAALIQEELEEREWDTLVSTPGSQRFLAQLAAEARTLQAAGQVEV